MGGSEGKEQKGLPRPGGADAAPGPLVAVVGPCAAGKSALVQALRERGVNAREVAQEHSYIPDMWLRLTAPNVLVFLDVTLEESLRRRPTDVTEKAWSELAARLDHARGNADLLIDTSRLTPDEVVAQAAGFLESLAGQARAG